MAKITKTSRVSLIGGNKASTVNPLNLTRKFKAVCITENIVLSKEWRNTKALAQADAASHIDKGHYIDYLVHIS